MRVPRDPGGLFGDATLNLTVSAAPPILASVSLVDTNLLLSWTGGIAPYQVQVSTSLANPAWQDFLGPVSTNSLAFSTSNPAAFYRILGQ